MAVHKLKSGLLATAIVLATGVVQRNASSSGSICDAIQTPAPGQMTFPTTYQSQRAQATSTMAVQAHRMCLQINVTFVSSTVH